MSARVAKSAKLAVVGHVEWAEFMVVDHVPKVDEIVQARESWSQPAGGGTVAAVQMAKLGGSCHFFTATGDDDLSRKVGEELGALGLTVHAAQARAEQRRAFVHLELEGDRAITTIGPRLGPRGEDDLPWDLLDEFDAVYVTAGDAAAIRAARAARRVVATVRAAEGLFDSGIPIDVLVASRNDAGEKIRLSDFRTAPAAIVRTDGARGGTIEIPGQPPSHWDPWPGPSRAVDSYGAGDSFAGGLTAGLGLGLPLPRAVSLGAFCGAKNVAGRGPYATQASASDLDEWRSAEDQE